MKPIFVQRGKLERVKPKERRSDRNLPVIWCIEPIVFECTYQGRRKRYTIGLKARGDGASAPWIARLIIDIFTRGLASRAFMIHDILCQCRNVEKEEADFVLNEAMKAAHFPGWLRKRIYNSVRGSPVRNNWPQDGLSAILRPDGLPGAFAECPIETLDQEPIPAA
ncbi:DUF1353 domain-containing protein [Rhizorhabdus sp.]|uniref:DUF1353 domain-containing protein n=1 Tax=Rhizorhabdus sp. TaxID=1968843 RepID=UPI0019A8A131|nr:DUF1353 domain-containing protein [Rhizorhabdus sp.]MBD3762481.1 DUF1353 domain-containing protein [Rhizorhabdus sp.]